MEFAIQNKEKLISLYNSGESTHSIARQFNTYQGKIRKALLFLGVKLRDYSEAQKLALDFGRVKHPTKGKKRNAEVKNKISESGSKAWKRRSIEKRQKFSEDMKKYWKNLSPEKRKMLQSNAMAFARRASIEGSRAEIYVRDNLIAEGWDVEFHVKGKLKREKLEIDLYLPEINAVVEIDGPSHFRPIWGEKVFQRQVQLDTIKNGLLLENGYNIIRIRQLDENLTDFRLKSIYSAVKMAAEYLKNCPPNNPVMLDLEVENGTIKQL